MKARIKETDEIAGVESTHRKSTETTATPIDWEQRRYEIAKDVLAASFSTPMETTSIQSYVHDCVLIADILIEELKKH